MVVRRAVFIQSLIVVVYVLFSKQAVCTWDFCNYPPNNPCEQKVPFGKDSCKTTRLCMQNTCWGGCTKPKKKFDQACKNEKEEAGIQGWENYKCCACNTDIITTM
ncbi:unnamed protein product [Porites evermanni]|uniref:Uncharacterized protein n=1 Tax=Porites evermanni TaxID=104178 RepID=A0ABN8M3Q9_9CNID|nr:unnamed protein product [Porites evermanni]